MKNKQLLSTLALAILLTGCGGSGSSTPAPTPTPTPEPTPDPTPVEGEIRGPFSTGTTAEPATVYYDLDTHSVVALTDEEAASNTEWDLAFKRTKFWLNANEDADVSLFKTSNNSDFFNEGGEARLDMFTAATPESELEDYTAVTFADIPAADSFVKDSTNTVMSDQFYNYDFATHQVSAADDKYFIVWSDDNFSQIRVTDITTVGREIGQITFGIAHQSAVDGESTFAEEVALVVDTAACADSFYIDLDMQATVAATDDWDVKLSCGAEGGSFTEGLQLADDALVLASDGNMPGVDPASAGFIGFTTDSVTQYAMEAGGQPWYLYNSQDHRVYSQYSVYMIKVADKTYKFQVTSYYDEEGNSGNYSFRADELVEQQ